MLPCDIPYLISLTKIIDHILKEMDQGNYTGVLFLDFKKAFNMVMIHNY
jgi:hypothetical protein